VDGHNTFAQNAHTLTFDELLPVLPPSEFNGMIPEPLTTVNRFAIVTKATGRAVATGREVCESGRE